MTKFRRLFRIWFKKRQRICWIRYQQLGVTINVKFDTVFNITVKYNRMQTIRHCSHGIITMNIYNGDCASKLLCSVYIGQYTCRYWFLCWILRRVFVSLSWILRMGSIMNFFDSSSSSVLACSLLSEWLPRHPPMVVSVESKSRCVRCTTVFSQIIRSSCFSPSLSRPFLYTVNDNI